MPFRVNIRVIQIIARTFKSGYRNTQVCNNFWVLLVWRIALLTKRFANIPSGVYQLTCPRPRSHLSCINLDIQIIIIMTHMLVIGSASTQRRLFSILNDLSNPIFSIEAPFYAITTLKKQSNHRLMVNFIIMLKTYFQ